MAIVTAKQGLAALHWALEKGADLAAPHPATQVTPPPPVPPSPPGQAPGAQPAQPAQLPGTVRTAILLPANLAESGSKSEHVRARVLLAIGALVVVLGGLAIIVATVHDPSFVTGKAPKAPVQGLTIFAVFFVAASAIERLLEPLSNMLPSATDKQVEADSKLAAAGKTVLANAHGIDPPDDATTLDDAAGAQDDANFRDYWKTLLLWAIATLIAMVACAFMRLYFLRTVGISNGPRAVEILASGLIIGAGTKPLHDLVSLVSKVSSSK